MGGETRVPHILSTAAAAVHCSLAKDLSKDCSPELIYLIVSQNMYTAGYVVCSGIQYRYFRIRTYHTIPGMYSWYISYHARKT